MKEIVGITGGTGFVGGHLSRLLLNEGHRVIIFTRHIPVKTVGDQISYAHLDAEKGKCDLQALKQVTVMINLAGAGIADKRWTAARKKEIVDSRVATTNFLVKQLKAFAPDCTIYISSSATGYYGPDKVGGAPFTEAAPPYNDFLGDTCSQWETASQEAASFLRTVILRFGVVLGKESGAFPKFAAPLSFGIMPLLGGGAQMMSWIEVNDLARLILFAMEQRQLSGIYNAVAPNPVTYRQLSSTIASAKRSLSIPLPVPAFLLKMALGELSTELLKSCTASAQKTLSTGFSFHCPDITSAVNAILSVQK